MSPVPEQPPIVCANCRQAVVPVDVAGHTQCPVCTRVIDECCSGETLEIREEAE